MPNSQGTMSIIRLDNAPTKLSSYLGPPDLPGMTANICCHGIFNITYQRSPWDLEEPPFNRTNATIDMAILDL